MKKPIYRGLICGSLLGLLILVPRVSKAADIEMGADILTAYVWRGVTVNDEGVIQPYADMTHESGLGFNVWGNLDLGDFNGALESGKFSEIDLIPYYAVPLEWFDLTVGLIQYLFPQAGSDTQTTEYFVSASFYITDGVSAGFDFYHDIDEVNAIYNQFNVNFDVGAILFPDLPEEWTIETDIGFGVTGQEFAEAYGGSESGGFNWITAVKVAYALSESAKINGQIAFVGNLDSDVLPDQPSDLYGGGGVSFAF